MTAIKALGLAILAALMLTAEAQTVAIITPATASGETDDIFAATLESRGWVKNKKVRIETRHWGGNVENLQRYVAEIVALKPDVIVTWGPQTAQAVKRATSDIPIVFLTSFTDAV